MKITLCIFYWPDGSKIPQSTLPTYILKYIFDSLSPSLTSEEVALMSFIVNSQTVQIL